MVSKIVLPAVLTFGLLVPGPGPRPEAIHRELLTMQRPAALAYAMPPDATMLTAASLDAVALRHVTPTAAPRTCGVRHRVLRFEVIPADDGQPRPNALSGAVCLAVYKLPRGAP